ncbi:MAG: DUF3106 domain-containing protein [Pseudomonadota bacterium]
MAGVRTRTLLKAALAAACLSAFAALAQQAAPAPAATAPKPVVGKAPTKALDKPLWATLTKPQQVALEPLAGEWDKMDTLRKQKWLDIANRYAAMKPDEQQRVHDRMREWVKLTPEQRRVARENYTRAKQIDPGKKSEQWEQYQQLPEEQKKKLAADAASAKAKVVNLPSNAQSKVQTVAPIKASKPPASAPSSTPAAAPAASGTNGK